LRRSSEVDQLLSMLTAAAAEVARSNQAELALAWLWSSSTREQAPRVSGQLSQILQLVVDHGRTEVEPGYLARHYFEDCLQLALRKARLAELRRNQSFR
jgi:hypothetical protein